jgi:hypothetical protein
MGSQQLWGTSAGVPSVESYTLQAIWGDDTRAKPEHDYQRRALKTYRDRNRWVSLWPRGGIMMGDPSGTECVGGYCDCFEPFSCDGEGTQSSNFIRGRVLDVSSNPVKLITVYAGDAIPQNIILRELPVAEPLPTTTIYVYAGDATPQNIILRNPVEAPSSPGAYSITITSAAVTLTGSSVNLRVSRRLP